MKRIFITHIVPKDKILDCKLSVAACNFSWNLIDGGTFDEYYSILPTFVRKKVDGFDRQICSKLRKFRLTRWCAPIVENICLFCRISRRSSVWYYNCTVLNATLIVLLKLLKPSVKQQMIILDYTPSRKPMERFFLWLSNRMDGTIKLADSPLFTVKNTVCLPGITPADGKIYPLVGRIRKMFLISGALGDNIAMLPILLEAFSMMPEMALHITGKAPDLTLVDKYTSRYKNIIYHGMVEYAEYLRILHETPFLLSTRSPEYPENQCNFPSKIIEALLHNRIVLSTLHYRQLDGIRYFKISANTMGLVDDLRRITAKDESELMGYANQSGEVKTRFGCDVWKRWMTKIENQQ